jgi:hypothetical protein
VIKAYSIVDEALKSIGLQHSPSKCIFYSTTQTSIEISNQLQDLQISTTKDGIIVAGSPIGNKKFCDKFIKDTINSTNAILETLVDIRSPSVGYGSTVMNSISLIKYCIPQRLTHILRTTPPLITSPFAKSLDFKIDNAVLNISRSSIYITDLIQAEQHLSTIFTPLDKGGMGFTSSLAINKPCYVSSIALIGTILAELNVSSNSPETMLPLTSFTQTLSELQILQLPCLKDLTPTSIYQKSYKKLQHQIVSEAIASVTYNTPYVATGFSVMNITNTIKCRNYVKSVNLVMFLVHG